jgi:hypothetical protein
VAVAVAAVLMTNPPLPEQVVTVLFGLLMLLITAVAVAVAATLAETHPAVWVAVVLVLQARPDQMA